MIRLFSNYFGTPTDITCFFSEVQWSGDKAQCARKLEITLAYSIFDKNQINTQIGPGTMVWLVDDGAGELFRGIVFNRELNSNQTLKFTAYDFLIYILKSKASYNFVNMTPEAITAQICSDMKIETGDIANIGVNVNEIVQNKGLYDIIMEAYSYASQSTGKQYLPTMSGTKLNIIEKGLNLIDFTADPSFNILNSVYSDNIENMINRVKIYGKKAEFTGIVVENTDWQKSYGILQDSITQAKNKDAKTEAALMLKGVEDQATLQVLGNVNVRTGCAIKTNIWYVSIMAQATWYVDADIHKWDLGKGTYTMQLTLHYQNLMDIKTGNVNSNNSSSSSNAPDDYSFDGFDNSTGQ
jgi:hypothetical protein